MGGKALLRVLLFAAPDVVNGLLSRASGGSSLDRGIVELVSHRHGDAVKVEVVTIDPVRSGVLLQEFAKPEIPDGLLERGLKPARLDPFYEFDLVVLSIEPEVTHGDVWLHQETGYQVDLTAAPIEIVSRVREVGKAEWRPSAPLSGFESGQNLARATHLLKERAMSHLVFFNGSTLTPGDVTYRYQQGEETLPERIRRLNVALVEISMEEGISIVDVDRLIAEVGGRSHIDGAFRYSSEICGLISEEFLRVVEDIGFFSKRALLPQMGRRVS